MKHKYRAVAEPKHPGYWSIEEWHVFGWRAIDSVSGEEAAQAYLQRLTTPKVLYPLPEPRKLTRAPVNGDPR